MALKTKKTGGLPPRILIYGPPKIGKSSFGANAPEPIFLQIEDGLDALNVEAFEQVTSFEEVMMNMVELRDEEHDRQTLVTDSLDHLERLIWKQVCAESNVERIELADGGYGKGYVAALNLWTEFYALQNELRKQRGMTIVNICHAQVKRFESPTTDAYDRYEVKLHKSAAALAIELSDIVLFANYYTSIKKEADSSKQKDDDKRKRGIGSGERNLYTEERPAFIAGNRYSLPPEITFDKDGEHWATIAAHVPYFSGLVAAAEEFPAPAETAAAETPAEEPTEKKPKKKK